MTVWCGSAPNSQLKTFGLSGALPKDKLDAPLGQTSLFLSATVAQKKDLRSFCGKLMFVAGKVPMLRPFLGMVWALASSSRVPLELVHCRRFRVARWWVQAPLSEVPVRVLPLTAS